MRWHEIRRLVRKFPAPAERAKSALADAERERAAATIKVAEPVKDQATGQLILDILAKYPQHKRVLFLRSKYDDAGQLSAIETAEVQKFGKLLLMER